MFLADVEMKVWPLIQWQWKNIARFTWRACLATIVAAWGVEHQWISLPALPLSVVGAAIGIFVAFRSNQAYDRWWEGRKLWGRLINTSRHIASQFSAYLPGQRELLVHRHMAYVHALRVVLRRERLDRDEDFLRRIDDGVDWKHATNVCHAILTAQLEAANGARDAGVIDGFKLSDIDESVRHLLDIQGGCERIKNTPLPRGYGFIGEVLIRYYALLLPFALYPEIYWLAIPATILVCFAFSLVSEIGRVLEDPFVTLYNGLPLMALSNTIERDLCTVLDEKPPAKTQPINAYVLL